MVTMLGLYDCVCASHFDLVSMMKTKLSCASNFIIIGRYIDHNERINPIDVGNLWQMLGYARMLPFMLSHDIKFISYKMAAMGFHTNIY